MDLIKRKWKILLGLASGIALYYMSEYYQKEKEILIITPDN